MQNQKKITDTIKSLMEDKFITTSYACQEYEQAIKEFEALVSEGTIKKRGYNLLTFSDAESYLHNQKFNT